MNTFERIGAVILDAELPNRFLLTFTDLTQLDGQRQLL